MKRSFIALGLVLPIGLVSSCCCMRHPHDGHESAEMVLCKECGTEKGSEKCCDPAAVRCEKCGMIQGSPGCCATK